MTTQVKAWGNSSAIRIPAEILRDAGIRRDDVLDIEIRNGDIVLTKTRRHKLLEERIAAYGGKLGVIKNYNWDSPEGREMF